MKSYTNFFEKIFLTLFFVGKIPFLPGTWGSLLTYFLGIFFIKYLNFGYLHFFFIATLAFIIGILLIDKLEKEKKIVHDSREIVIDEFVGMFYTFGIICIFTIEVFNLFLGFILFRVFDMMKPSFIGYVDKNFKGGIGVIFDDVLAGIVAGISTLLIYFAFNFL